MDRDHRTHSLIFDYYWFKKNRHLIFKISFFFVCKIGLALLLSPRPTFINKRTMINVLHSLSLAFPKNIFF